MDTTELRDTSAKMVVGVGAAWYSAYSLQEWVAILTIGYVSLQIGLLLPKYWIALVKFYEQCHDWLFEYLKNRNDRKQSIEESDDSGSSD